MFCSIHSVRLPAPLSQSKFSARAPPPVKFISHNRIFVPEKENKPFRHCHPYFLQSVLPLCPRIHQQRLFIFRCQKRSKKEDIF